MKWCFKKFTLELTLCNCILTICVNFALADKNTDNNKTFIEANYFSKNGDNFFANGNVILKRPEVLINADEVEAICDIIQNQRDINTLSKINEVNYAGNKITEKEKYKFYAKNWVKMRTLDDDILFAKSMFYNENNKNGTAENVQIYPGGKYDHMEIYATKFDKKNNIYVLNNVSVCPCKFFTDSNIEHNRTNFITKINSDDELLEKPNEKNAIDNTDKEMHSKIGSSLISFKTRDLIYDKENNLITFKHLRAKIFGIPVFYLPFYSVHADDGGDTGVLFPNIVGAGRKQIGIELPVYLKIRPNIDILVSRMQYFNTGLGKPGYKNAEDNEHKLKDLYRFRESSTQFRFRHLISTNNAYENFYRLEAMMTDRTQLVDNSTGLGKVDSSGAKIMGYRWMVDFRTRMKLTKTTFLKADVNFASDKNLLYYYRFDRRQVQENRIHLYDVTENRYLSAELLNYQMRMIYVDPKTNPIVFPVIRGEYDFKKDKLGGNFYIRSKTYYINREEGFNVATAGVDFGYHLPYFAKFGTKFTFDAMGRGVFNHVDYNPYTSVAEADNYGGLLNGRYYIPAQYRKNQLLALGFGKIQAEHPILIKSIFGKTIITPKVAIRSSLNGGRNLHIPVEDNLAMHMNYYNAFDLVQSSGFGVYDKGQSFVYGADVVHRFNKNISVLGGVAQNVRLGHALSEMELAEYTGFRRTMSDILAHFGMKLYNFTFTGYMNYDQHNKEVRVLGVNASYSGKYFSIYGYYDSYSKNSTIFGYPIDLISANIGITPFNNLRIVAGATYNLNGIQYNEQWRKAGFTTYRFGIYYKISCISVGFVISRTNIVITNTPSDIVYRFKVAFKGF